MRETSDCFVRFDYNTCDGGGAGKSACGGLRAGWKKNRAPTSVGKCFNHKRKPGLLISNLWLVASLFTPFSVSPPCCLAPPRSLLTAPHQIRRGDIISLFFCFPFSNVNQRRRDNLPCKIIIIRHTLRLPLLGPNFLCARHFVPPYQMNNKRGREIGHFIGDLVQE